MSVNVPHYTAADVPPEVVRECWAILIGSTASPPGPGHEAKLREALAYAIRAERRRIANPAYEANRERGRSRTAPYVADYEAGMSMNQVARKYDVTYSTVWHALHRAGVKVRAKGDPSQRLSE